MNGYRRTFSYPCRIPVNPHRQIGISLIEIMVAMVIDLLLLIVITAYIINQSSLRNELDKASRQMENGRYAMFILQQDINNAGYYGSWEPPITQPASLPDPCSITPTTADLSLVMPIQGYDNPSTPPSCLPDYKTGTDILVIRRADTALPEMIPGTNILLPDTNILDAERRSQGSGPLTAPVSNEIYLQAGSASEASPFDPALGIQNADIQYGNPVGFALGKIPSNNLNPNPIGTKADGTNPSVILKKANYVNPSTLIYASPLNNDLRIAANIHKYHVHIYFISPCSIATGTATDAAGINKACRTSPPLDDNGKPIPTLKRLELKVPTGKTERQWVEVPLVEGIDNIQFDYGIDRDLDGAPDSTSLLLDNSYLKTPASTDWINVMVVRVNILARNNEFTFACPSTNAPPYCTNVYNLGLHGTVGPFTDGYKRHVYSESVLVVNPVKRRQQ